MHSLTVFVKSSTVCFLSRLRISYDCHEQASEEMDCAAWPLHFFGYVKGMYCTFMQPNKAGGMEQGITS